MNTTASAYFEKMAGAIHLMERQAGASRHDTRANGDAMSHNGLLMTEALAAAHNAPDTRRERIDALRAQLANGTYEINPLRIAEALIRENPGLFKIQPHID